MAPSSNESGRSTPSDLTAIAEEDPSLQISAVPHTDAVISRPPPVVRQTSPRMASPEGSPNQESPTISRTSSKTMLSRSMRSPSASSFLYHMKKVPMNDAIPLGHNADPAVVKEFMEIAEERAKAFKASVHRSWIFQVLWYLMVSCVIYFGFIGLPLWDGIAYSIYKWFNGDSHVAYGFLIFFLWGTSIAWMPLLFCSFEKDPKTDSETPVARTDASETCLLIPAYKAAAALPRTIECALKIFKPNQIFIVANGDSTTPLDNTEDVCKEYGVNHAWVPIGSKITAEFVGVMLAKEFKYCMLIDDDVHLPANLPIVTDRISSTREHGSTVCVGYSIKSTGPDGSKGTWVQQAQDIEYKLSGLTRHFTGTYGSAVFPHGAIILWERDILEKLFWGHPGYKISEDWYFGHTCRSAGFRIQFCTQVFVPTETPPTLFFSGKSARGGYGEMTIFKQRFYRWNFFYLYRLREDLNYLFFAWRLGRYEWATKLYVLTEIYGTFIYATRPIFLPISFIVQPKLAGIITGALIGVYLLAVVFFNAWHLRRKQEMVSWKIIPVYMLMKTALVFVDTLSVYYSLYAYAGFFAKRHPRVTENYPALMAARTCINDDIARRQVAAAVPAGVPAVPIPVDVTTSGNEEEIQIAPLPPAMLRDH